VRSARWVGPKQCFERAETCWNLLLDERTAASLEVGAPEGGAEVVLRIPESLDGIVAARAIRLAPGVELMRASQMAIDGVTLR
jgi:hypothetical protein